MANSARNKGRDFESMIRDYFRSIGLPVERIPAGMKDDRGDLSGIAGWTLVVCDVGIGVDDAE